MPSFLPSATETVIAVSPDGALATHPRLFAALEAAFPVTFRPSGAVASPAAIIELAGSRSPAEGNEPAESGVPRIAFIDDAATAEPGDDVQLLGCEPVDRRLRGITLDGQRPARGLQPDSGTEEVLATDRSSARWTVSRGPQLSHRVAATVPELGPTEILRDTLLSDHSLPIVAMTHFLRAVCMGSDFEPPPLRASIVFDDPNVRWRSYGFIDYQQLIKHADAHNYHAVMAMVPLDAVGAHGATVSLFDSRPDRLSLAFHGNSHLKDELMAPSDAQSALSLCAQALRRVARFESRTGLNVDRVMTPPHGMCSESVASALAALRFDALCALHPEPWVEEPSGDHLLAAWGPGSFPGPSAVIPRFPMYISQAEIALRAFVDNPVVLYGHQDDLASGFDLLEQAAARVNSLGEVQWMSLGEIALSNVSVRTDDDAMVVRPYSGRVRVRLPEATSTLVVEEPRNPGDVLVGWSTADTDGATHNFGDGVPCSSSDETEIRLRSRIEVDPAGLQGPTWRPWAAMRRAASEARDRAMPLKKTASNVSA